jgi:hypothetical protein
VRKQTNAAVARNVELEVEVKRLKGALEGERLRSRRRFATEVKKAVFKRPRSSRETTSRQ